MVEPQRYGAEPPRQKFYPQRGTAFHPLAFADCGNDNIAEGFGGVQNSAVPAERLDQAVIFRFLSTQSVFSVVASKPEKHICDSEKFQVLVLHPQRDALTIVLESAAAGEVVSAEYFVYVWIDLL